VPRRSILSVAERESLLSLPTSQDDLIRHYSLNESDLSLIRQRRGASNRLGFAILLSYMRYPGMILGVGDEAYAPLLRYVAQQVNVDAEAWKRYGQREQTRREHLLELQEVFGFKPFTGGHYRSAVAQLADVALQTDKGIVLATTLVESLRNKAVLLPALGVIERVCSEAITRANRRKYGVAVLESISQDEFNPNVALEYGFMRAMGKPTLLLKENRMALRADIMGTLWGNFDMFKIDATITDAIKRWAGDCGI
jgi:hypothetical protein